MKVLLKNERGYKNRDLVGIPQIGRDTNERKDAEKMKKIILKIKMGISILMVLIMVLSLLPTLSVNATVAEEEKKYVEYHGEGFEIFLTVTDVWNNGYNAEVNIKNTGNEKLEAWAVAFSMPHAIKEIWNATIYSHEGQQYIVKNDGSTKNIDIGQSVQFGYSAEFEDEIILPIFFDFYGSENIVDMNSFEIELSIKNEWDSAFNGEISIKNISKNTIENWKMAFDFGCEITDIWGAVIEKIEDNRYYIVNADYNANIAPGEIITIGFNALQGENREINNYILRENITVKEDKSEEIDYNKDSDGDGIPDYDEELLGTDKNKIDTDGDGLSDYDELEFGYNPKKVDTDEDGIADGDEDLDSDGITNLEEFEIGTDWADADTDNDGLTDYDEINIYYTDPLVADSDGDGIEDGIEIKFGLDPTKKDSNDNGIVDTEENITYTYKATELIGDYNENEYPDVTLTGKCQMLNSFEMKTTERNMLINRNIPGYIGDAYDFSIEGEFEKAEVKFNINEDLFVQNFSPALYYFNEDTQLLELVPNQKVVDNCVVTNLEHFSTYILLNKVEFEKVWDTDILCLDSSESKKPMDIAYVIDASGSMSYDRTPKNDPSGLRITLSKKMVEKMRQTDRGMVVSFATSANLLSSLTNDKTLLIAALNKVGSYGTTAMKDAIHIAANDFEKNLDDNHRKIMIVITDGLDNNSSYTTNSVIKQAKQDNITIYTIGLGKSLNESELKNIATSTGGKYYYASVANDLKDIYDDIEDETVDYGKDSNGDGISDYHTKLLCDGVLTSGTGIPVFGGVPYEDVQANADYDGDGLKNGEEIEVTQLGSGAYVTVTSNPMTKYSDEDIYTDYEEVKKYKSNPLKSNMIVFSKDINDITDDSKSLANKYEDDYLNSNTKSIGVWLGNNLFGSNYSEKEMCEDALVDFFESKNEKLEEQSEALTVASYIQQLGAEISLLLDHAMVTYKNKADTIDVIISLNKEIEHLKQSISDLEKSSDSLTKDQFYKLYDDLYQRLLKAVSNNAELKNALNQKAVVKGRFEILSQGKSVGKVLKIVNISFGILQTGIGAIEGYEDYVKFTANMDVINNNIYVLEVLSDNAWNDGVKKAAKNLLNNARLRYISVTKEIVAASANEVANIGIHYIIASIPYVGFWTELIISLGNMFTNVSDMSKYAVRVCGDSCASRVLSSDLKSYLAHYISKSNDNQTIYTLYGDSMDCFRNRYINVIDMKIFGEEDMIKLQDAPTKLVKKICELMGNDRDNVKKICKSNISYFNSKRWIYNFK